MNFEKNDKWVLESISQNTGVYEILYSGFNQRKQFIPYNDLDQGLNRLVTNQLVILNKKKYSITSKGVEYLQRMANNLPGSEDGLDWPPDIEMEKAPNLLHYFVFPREYNDALAKLVDFVGEGKIKIGWSIKKPRSPKPSQSRKRIEKLFSEKGITACHLDLGELCKTLREFMNEKYDCENDALLYETGVFDSCGKDVFSLIFMRQFSIADKNDQYDHVEQLSIALQYQNSYEFSRFRDAIWSFDFPSIDDFFGFIQKTASFEEITRSGKIIDISYIYDRV